MAALSPMSEREAAATFKLLLIGDSGTGKSSLLLRFTDDTWLQPDEVSATIGVDFKVKMMEVDGKRYKLTIWDTAGQERFRTLTSSYYRGAQGVILVYDVSNRSTFDHLQLWFTELDTYSSSRDVVKMIVGNKSDKDTAGSREVSRKEGEAFAKRMGTLFVESSAKTKTGVREAFVDVVRSNQNVALVGSKVVLVPYREEHVSTYHEWMKDEELQRLTGSEPLTLDAEYEMCRNWRDDQDKCTFIILDPSAERYRVGGLAEKFGGMVGDVNLFLYTSDDREWAEVELMIAEPDARHKGFGREAVLIMMQYGIQSLRITRFECKIGDTNIFSLKLFESIGFKETTRSAVFQEVTLEYVVAGGENRWPSFESVEVGS
ncbi:hypothetical protein SmJEL517_g02566 [Synchytrium microbalum]|uniref:N-acetyltransferase domain-containing protein n=1 Tax=Synchytrium microbalum TaxID=1806994 RepID=A0A507C048_9FUNG|nr:uncharacterized protein SmJEL517_g02566 [Synchytrium microbalum]TPX34900.1 hypothetical protein SmJEL517_g02566 [Synchytrium microbalum]